MGKRVALLSATQGRLAYGTKESLGAAVRAIDSNVGNLVFQYAVADHLREPFGHVHWGSDPDVVRSSFDVLVLPEANAANPYWDWSDRAEWIERCDLPVVVVGLGAQARSLGEQVVLRAGTVRYLRALSERSEQIGVRGPFTADVLAGIGVDNTAVIGCPSNFISANERPGADLLQRYSGTPDRISVAAGSTVRSLRPVERALAAWAFDSGGLVFPQSGPAIAAQVGSGRSAAAARRKLFAFQRPPSQWHPAGWRRFRTENARRSMIVPDVERWMELLKTCDLSVGTRFHGNMVAFQAGVPAVWLTHDARTEEMCEVMGLPALPASRFDPRWSPDELLGAVDFDADAHDRKHRVELRRAYLGLFESAGVHLTERMVAPRSEGNPR